MEFCAGSTDIQGDKAASTYWREEAYKQHENEMLAVLKAACGIEDIAKECEAG